MNGNTNERSPDIYTTANEEWRAKMLSVIDTARSALLAGNLRVLIVLPVHADNMMMLDAICAGPPETVVMNLERTKLHVLAGEEARITREREQVLASLSSPFRGQA